jgi:hypothetical protein
VSGLTSNDDQRQADRFAVFDIAIRKRSRSWEWRVCSWCGDVVMRGREASRAAANYKSARALFLLLSSPRIARREVSER